MGGLPCCRHTEQRDYILKEEYKSILDEKIAVFEEENSGLKLLDIDMFLEYITNISEDTIDHTNFSLFVSQKIIENPLFSKEFMGEENFQKVQKVKDFMDILFNRLIRCYFKYRSLRKYQEIEFALDKIFLFDNVGKLCEVGKNPPSKHKHTRWMCNNNNKNISI